MKKLFLSFVFIISLVPLARIGAASPARPNILYFYVDDMGWGSIGPNGQAARRAEGKPYVQTPCLDRLATEGVNFTHGYGCHVCSPARSSQQTGFHQGHTFADRNDPNNAKKAMRADDICMGEALAAAGYVTGYWGKWGYGASADKADPVIQNVQTLPTSHGYQYVLAELHHVRAHTFFQPTLWSAPAPEGSIGGLHLVPNSMAAYRENPDYPSMPALQDDPDYPETAYCDDAYAMAALDFVRRQGTNYHKTGQPFFGLLAVQIPHAPFGEVAKLPKWNMAYANSPYYSRLGQQIQQWCAMVTRIDAHFGNILAALEDPNNDGDKSDSVADNTLVIFQSDNGGPAQECNGALDTNGGLTGSKGKIQEGGIRVPLVMRWPAKINADSMLKVGTNSDKVVDVTDLLPTFCELAGAPRPLGIDGVSIAPTLTGEGHQRSRKFIIHEAGNGQSIIQGNYKLVRSNAQAKGNKKKGSQSVPLLKLYDLEADRAETNDIAADHKELVKQLETSLLGERVAEPRGFANTYHHWTGKDGAATSDPANWSDYNYTNEGITYMTDDGGPRLSWTARIENLEDKPCTARADTDLQLLGLEIRGGLAKNARQSLVLDPKVNLTGRNEIRLAQGATLTVNEGTISSLRWIEIEPGASLTGSGTIDATVYNNGSMAVTGTKQPKLTVTTDYHQSADATLSLTVNSDTTAAMQVAGEVHLGGILVVSVSKKWKDSPGSTYTILTADRISGKFANPGDEVVASDGSRHSIQYLKSAVTITRK